MHNQTTQTKSWNQALNRFEYQFTFAFTNRDQYRDFRQLWKESYAALGPTIREQKELVRTTMRQHEYAGKHQVRLLELKLEATVQLAMRRAAKVESNRQYLAAKQVAT